MIAKSEISQSLWLIAACASLLLSKAMNYLFLFCAASILLPVSADVMKMVDQEWIDKFVPREYKRLNEVKDENGDVVVTKDNNFGYSEQGLKDLDEVGSLVGGGDSDLLGILRPYYSMVEMSANGNKRGMGSYIHVLPDSSEGDDPIYTLGASFYGGIEPAGAKMGYMNRPFGK